MMKFYNLETRFTTKIVHHFSPLQIPPPPNPHAYSFKNVMYHVVQGAFQFRIIPYMELFDAINVS